MRRRPTIPGVPIAGSALDLLRDPVGFFVDAAATQGPVFDLRILHHELTVVTGDAAVELASDDAGGPLTRDGLFSTFRDELGAAIFSAEGPAHQRLRRLLGLSLSRAVAAEAAPQIARDVMHRVRTFNRGHRFDGQAHGSQFRCRIRTPDGWKWCPAADSPDAAILRAQGAEEPAQDADPVDESDKSKGSPPSKDAMPKLEGPYSHRGKVRYRVVSSDGRRWAPAGRTEKEALRFAEHYAETTARKGNITLRDAIEKHVESKRQAGARPSTLEGTRSALIGYFGGILDSAVGRLTCEVAVTRP